MSQTRQTRQTYRMSRDDPTASLRRPVWSDLPERTKVQQAFPWVPDDVDLPPLPWLATMPRIDEWIGHVRVAMEAGHPAAAATWQADIIGRALYCRPS